MTLRRTLLAAAIGLAGLFAVAPAGAAIVTFDLTSGNLSPSSYGNSKTFTSGGVSMTVTAWSFTGSGTTLQSAALAQYSGAGLGVCDRGEGTNCSSPQHQIDNSSPGKADFVLMVFNQAIDPVSMVIDPYGCAGSGCTPDRDVSYWLGNIANANLDGLTAAALDALFGHARIDDTASASNSERTVTFASGTGTALLIGAKYGDTNDFWKLEALSVSTTNQVPEPAALAMLGIGLVGLSFAGRARRRQS